MRQEIAAELAADGHPEPDALADLVATTTLAMADKVARDKAGDPTEIVQFLMRAAG